MSSAINCDPPHVRDTVTLECTNHTPCGADQDLVSGSCVPSCPQARPMRDAAGQCACPPGTTLVTGAELGGCVRPGELDFSSMCKRPHQHFDGSIVPRCVCDPGHVSNHDPAGEACIRDCKSPLAYDPVTDRCQTCAGDQDALRGVCVPKCPTPSRREPSTGECTCRDGAFLDHGQCVHCLAPRVYDAAAKQCNCPPGTEDWGYEGCFAACPAGQHRMGPRCDADCTRPLVNDVRTGACRSCDASAGAFLHVTHGRQTCVACSFDEVLDAQGACTCRPGFRSANGHCVNP